MLPAHHRGWYSVGETGSVFIGLELLDLGGMQGGEIGGGDGGYVKVEEGRGREGREWGRRRVRGVRRMRNKAKGLKGGEKRRWGRAG